jgi:hypothetical protein
MDTCDSLRGAITTIHESLACLVSERLGSTYTHYVRPSWSPVDVGRNPRSFGSLRAHRSSDLNWNDQEVPSEVPSETTVDHKTNHENLDDIPGMDKSFEMVTADSSVKENAVEESQYNNEVFVMPQPAVEETPKEDCVSEELYEAADIDEPTAKPKYEPCLYTSDSHLFSFWSGAPLSKNEPKKSKKTAFIWGNEIQPFGDSHVAVAPEEPTKWAAPAPEPVSGDLPCEPYCDTVVAEECSVLEAVSEDAPFEAYCDPAVVQDCLDMPASSHAFCDKPIQETVLEGSPAEIVVIEELARGESTTVGHAIVEAIEEEPAIAEQPSGELEPETPVEDILPAKSKKSKKGKFKKGKKKSKMLSSFSSDAPAVGESLDESATPVANLEDPIPESVHEEPTDSLAEEILSMPQTPTQEIKGSTSSGWCSSCDEPIAEPATEETSSTASTVDSLVDLGSASAEFTGSESAKSEEREEPKLYDVYLTVKCEHYTYRILTTLSENTKAGILKIARSTYRARMTRYGRHSVPEFYIESAASDDGPIDVSMLGSGDWTKRLNFFAAHTKSGIPELTVNFYTED